MTTAVTPTQPQQSEGQAFVESLQVNILESFPIQVQAVVSGNLSDGCTSLATINVQQQDNTFMLDLVTNYDTQMVCTQALVPFSEAVALSVAGLPSGTYTVTADGLSEDFRLEIVDAPSVTPEVGNASLSVNMTSARAGETVRLTGVGFPAVTMVEIGIGPVDSEYTLIASAQAGADGRFTTNVAIPDYVDSGQQWVFVAVANTSQVLTNPILIEESDDTSSPPVEGVNVPVNGLIGRTYMYLIAVEDGGQSGPQVGCNDSVIPVVIDIEPTIAPLTAAITRLLSLDEQNYGESGLYNALYQSDLTLQGINIVNREATIALTGNLQLGGVCDDPRVLAQLEYTALQYNTVDTVSVLLNGQPLTANQ
jgi:hypothetical protein